MAAHPPNDPPGNHGTREDAILDACAKVIGLRGLRLPALTLETIPFMVLSDRERITLSLQHKTLEYWLELNVSEVVAGA